MASFTNQATLRYGGGVLYSNVVSGTIEAALTLQKVAVGDSYSPGGAVSYAISIVNNGASDFTGLTLTDDLGAQEVGGQTVYPLRYVGGSAQLFRNGELQPAPTVAAESPLQITGLTIPAGGSAVLVYQTETTEYASPASGAEITNTVTLSGNGLPEPLTASATVTAAETAALGIVKTLEPQSVRAQGQLSYGFTLQNTGNAPAAGLVVEDIFTPILNGLSVSFNGVPWTEGVNYSYDEQTGAFATLPGQISLPEAQFTQDPATGVWSVTPAEAVLTVSGTV